MDVILVLAQWEQRLIQRQHQQNNLALYRLEAVIGTTPFYSKIGMSLATTSSMIGAGIVFVGLGCPKQERWMAEHKGRVQAVMIGVGAAFDFHAGTVSRAPAWMRNNGLEWLHRLGSEPRRLWKRYLVTNTLFVVGAIRQLAFGQAR